MAKGLNFRNFTQPTLPITMNDAEGTLFSVVTPSVEMMERLEANQDAIVQTFNKGDEESVEAVWELVADLISFNREHRKVTAEDLKGRYEMSYEMLMAFIVAYGDFIAEIENAKN